MKSKSDLIQTHFNKKSKEFDSIYSGEKNRISFYLDKKFRWDMEKRFERTLDECSDSKGKTIIDIGCGSGRYMEALKAHQPKLILGVDFAPTMIRTAQSIVKQNAPDTSCRFVIGDFSSLAFKRPFDISLAIGLFDYVEHPLPMLKRIRKITGEKMIASFPRRGTVRSLLRKWRLKFLACPVFFYSGEDVKSLLGEAGFSDVRLETFGQLIFVVAR